MNIVILICVLLVIVAFGIYKTGQKSSENHQGGGTIGHHGNKEPDTDDHAQDRMDD